MSNASSVNVPMSVLLTIQDALNKLNHNQEAINLNIAKLEQKLKEANSGASNHCKCCNLKIKLRGKKSVPQVQHNQDKLVQVVQQQVEDKEVQHFLATHAAGREYRRTPKVTSTKQNLVSMQAQILKEDGFIFVDDDELSTITEIMYQNTFLIAKVFCRMYFGTQLEKSRFSDMDLKERLHYAHLLEMAIKRYDDMLSGLPEDMQKDRWPIPLYVCVDSWGSKAMLSDILRNDKNSSSKEDTNSDNSSARKRMRVMTEEPQLNTLSGSFLSLHDL